MRYFPFSLLAAFAAFSAAHGADCSRTSTGLIPLTELRQGMYLGQFQGGLYPDGLNIPPPAHAAAAEAAAHAITPLNTTGQPDQNGKYVLLSIGMSNTTQEFCGGNPCASYSLMGQAAAHPMVNHATLVIVDGAAGGQTATTWDSPSDQNYNRVRDTKLAPLGLSEQQVRVAWVKVANPSPNSSLPSANADAFTLVSQLANIVRAMKVRYPNLELVFLSSRIYAGYADTALNPEPYAYESGFAVKRVIQAQINQMATGIIDPHAGNLDFATVAPVMVWGPYLWADGLTPRGDGLTYLCSDFQTDGTHPSATGREKVANLLMQRWLFTRDGAPWFRDGGGPPCPADVDDGTGSGNSDGGVTVDDLIFYLGLFDAGDPRADLDNGTMRGLRDGGITIEDLLYYLSRFDAGC